MRHHARTRVTTLLVTTLLALGGGAYAGPPAHPLDTLTTSEYWTVYDVLRQSWRVDADTLFASVLLREPAKKTVLAWKPGDPVPREADVVLLRNGQTIEAQVDIAGKRLVSLEVVKGVHAPFAASEMFGADEFIKKDTRVIDALRKRGITDLTTVGCVALPSAHVAVPEQQSRRIGFGSCSQLHGSYNPWGRAIEGLTFQVDMVAKKILKVTDTGIAPVAIGAIFEEIPERPRHGTTPVALSQPQGPSYTIKDSEVAWQNWRFRFRIDQRVGPVLNLVRYDDGTRQRSVMYEGSLSELFVPYMDPGNGWSNRIFIDAGEFYAGPGVLKPLRAGLDCPASAAYFDAASASERGAPTRAAQAMCIFERAGSDPAWRHFEGNEVYGRPSRELIVRSALVIGNYDYIIDWRFEQDGTIVVAVGATGVIETKTSPEKRPTVHTMASGARMPVEYGQFVADHTIGVNHDHYFSFRLDLDIDGEQNSFMAHRLVEQKLKADPMRRSIWVAQPSIAAVEKDAVMDVSVDRPSMWMFVNPNVRGSLGYPTGYEVMAGSTARSLMSADDPAQRVGAFSEHQFWVTPYDRGQRYASGVYPTSSEGGDGLATWVKANRPIENTDIVGWYTMGFHHVPRAEDWPVMPTMWHQFQIRPFNFFSANPALDLPKSN